jgi:ATP-dependent Zn protease
LELTERFPRATAFHEAGHAVAAWSFGLSVKAVRVSSSDASGGAEIGDADHLPLIEQVAICLAGIAAEDIFGFKTHELAAFSDYAKVLELIEANGISEVEQGLKLRNDGYDCAHSHLEIHKSRVVELAERLSEKGRVGASEFLELMRG